MDRLFLPGDYDCSFFSAGYSSCFFSFSSKAFSRMFSSPIILTKSGLGKVSVRGLLLDPLSLRDFFSFLTGLSLLLAYLPLMSAEGTFIKVNSFSFCSIILFSFESTSTRVLAAKCSPLGCFPDLTEILVG
jgi:hypothetical protein